MATLRWDEEKKRVLDTYERADSGSFESKGVPVERSITERIAHFGKQAEEASHQLQEARVAYRRAEELKAKCEARFADVTEQLIRALHEHREGTPEGVPYPR